MFDVFTKTPRLNGTILGLIQGVPQGIDLPNTSERLLDISNEAMPLMIGFGLLGPPILAFLSFVMVQPRPNDWWAKLCCYVNPYYWMFFGGMSLGLIGWYALVKVDFQGGGYVLCAFFIAVGVGFAVAGYIENYFHSRRISG